LFRKDILPKAELTLDVSLAAYRVGQTDFLQLLDNWRQLLKFQITVHQLDSQLRQTLSSLERIIGGPLPATPRQDAASTSASPVPPVPPASNAPILENPPQ
jgi:outer membrane protein TolC